MALSDSQIFSSESLVAGEEALREQQVKVEPADEKQLMEAELQECIHALCTCP